MLEDNIVELGTDINRDWSFINGDLALVDNETNIIQSILNRLNCEYDSLDTYYFEYGTDLSSFLGFKASAETLEFIKIEVTETLNQDPRLSNFDVEATYNGNGEVALAIHIIFNEDDDLTLSLVITELEGVVIDDEGLSADSMEDLDLEED